MRFFLGTHRPYWLWQLNVPLFVSHNTMNTRKTFGRALAPWALDSGGFTELSQHGRWRTGPDEWIDHVRRYQDEIGRVEWAAPQDWMCEPFMITKTGLSVREHQDRTVQNYLDLRDHGPFIPVLQGWTLADYHACVDLYEQAAIDLTAEPVVGVGSVCRRQSTTEIGLIMRSLHARGLRLHGFGVKKEGVALYGRFLASSDSMAWSYSARRDWPLPGCAHKSCANCSRYALRWRRELVAQDDQLVMEFAA